MLKSKSRFTSIAASVCLIPVTLGIVDPSKGQDADNASKFHFAKLQFESDLIRILSEEKSWEDENRQEILLKAISQSPSVNSAKLADILVSKLGYKPRLKDDDDALESLIKTGSKGAWHNKPVENAISKTGLIAVPFLLNKIRSTSLADKSRIKESQKLINVCVHLLLDIYQVGGNSILITKVVLQNEAKKTLENKEAFDYALEFYMFKDMKH